MSAQVKDGYQTLGELIGLLLAAIAFFVVYAAAIGSVGWVIGIALGWIAASIAAALAYAIGKGLWPLALLAGLYWLAFS